MTWKNWQIQCLFWWGDGKLGCGASRRVLLICNQLVLILGLLRKQIKCIVSALGHLFVYIIPNKINMCISIISEIEHYDLFYIQ